MNKDLHDIDELFRSALEGHKETPSPRVKESLDASLDKIDAESYRKRFIVWKRAAILLLLLLTGFVLFESGILKTKTGSPAQIAAGKHPNSAPAEKQEEGNVNEVAAGNTIDNINSSLVDYDDRNTTNNRDGNSNNTKPINDNTPGQQGQIDITVQGTGRIDHKTNSKKKPLVSKIADQKNNFPDAQSEFITTNGKKGARVISPGPDKNRFLSNSNSLPKEKIDPLQPLEKIAPAEIARMLTNNVNRTPLLAGVDSILENKKSKNTKNKKVKFFNPFWMSTAFFSYDKVGYKLDSDEPSAVNSLKHREAHEPSYSGGILLTRQLTRRWGLQSGIVYSTVAIGMKPQKTYAFQDPTGDIAYKYITSSGYAFFKPGFGPQPAVGDSLTTAEGKHLMDYISVPLVVKHTISNKKISLTPGAGIEANFITKANLEVDIEDGFNREIVIVRKLNGTKIFYWSFVADAEIRYTVNKKLSLNVRPVFRHAISPITKNNVVETLPYSFGLGAGITIKF